MQHRALLFCRQGIFLLPFFLFFCPFPWYYFLRFFFQLSAHSAISYPSNASISSRYPIDPIDSGYRNVVIVVSTPSLSCVKPSTCACLCGNFRYLVININDMHNFQCEMLAMNEGWVAKLNSAGWPKIWSKKKSRFNQCLVLCASQNSHHIISFCPLFAKWQTSFVHHSFIWRIQVTILASFYSPLTIFPLIARIESFSRVNHHHTTVPPSLWLGQITICLISSPS